MIDDSGELIDYILYGRDNKPLAIIEETETKQNPVAGRMKAIRVAEKLERKYGYKPIIYYTDGYHIFCIDQLGFHTGGHSVQFYRPVPYGQGESSSN
jgi:type I restriction enzyme R subunit